MSADLPIQLRSLTQEYHDGKLNLTTYRSMRAALLDSLVAGVGTTSAAAAAAVAATQPRAGTWRQADAITRPGKLRATAADSTTSEPALKDEATGSRDAQLRASGTTPASGEGARDIGSRDAGSRDAVGKSRQASAFPVRSIAIVIAVLLIAGLGFWLWRSHASSSADTSGAAPNAGEHDRVRDLLAQFTDRADWGDAHLAALNTDLLELGGARMAAATSEPWFQRFIEEVRQRLKEQQALASTPLSADNSPLAALAVTVGLDLNAPDAAIHIAALPPPAVPQSAVTPAPREVKTATTASAAKDTSVTHAAGGEGLASNPTAGTNGSANAKVGADLGGSVHEGANADAVPSVQIETREGACRVELIGSRRPFCHDFVATGAEGPPLALIPAGAFDMGSSAAPEEQPVHRVTVREPFAISVYEVSQGEFRRFCEHSGKPCPPQPWSGDDYPVVNVSWDDARAYANWLSSVTHHRYALPTEAQWEYAARAGRTGLFPSGDALSPTDAQYSMLAKQTAAARRSQKFNANAFRLMHTVGNVREWVEDAWTQSFAGAPSDGSATTVSQPAQRVARGGSYADGVARLRLSMREGLPATTRDATTGFRIVRELP